MNGKLMDIEEVSQMLGMSVSGIYCWVSQRKIPFIKIGRSLRFEIDEVRQWLEEKKIMPRDN